MIEVRVNHRLRNWLVALLIGVSICFGCKPTNQIERIFLDNETVLINDSSDIPLLTNDLDRLANIRIVLLEPTDSVGLILAEINKLSNVRAVHCCYFGVDVNAMKSLTEMPSIEELSFFGVGISDDAAAILANDQKIKKLTFSLVTVSPEMVSRIKTARPNLDFQQEE